MMRNQWNVRRGLIVAVLAMGLLTLASCFTVPLGDPAQSRVDERLLGHWHNIDMGDETQVVTVSRWDERTYCVIFRSYLEISAQIVPGKTDIYKAWLTNVGGQTFITMQQMGSTSMGSGDRPVYLIARLTVEENQITAQGLQPDADALKSVADSAALAQAIEANLNNESIYLDSRNVFRRMNAASARDQAILRAFQQ